MSDKLRIWKEYSEEQTEKARTLLEQHNKNVVVNENTVIPDINYISVGRKQQVYFTFWKLRPKAERKDEFVKSLSTDLVTAVERAIELTSPNIRIELEVDMNRTMLKVDYSVLTFGKYAGQNLQDVAIQNPGYIFWLVDNYKPRKSNKRSNELYAMAVELKKEILADLTEKNQETSTSQYVGVVGQNYTLNLNLVKLNDNTKKLISQKSEIRYGQRYTPTADDIQEELRTTAVFEDQDGNKYRKVWYGIDTEQAQSEIEKFKTANDTYEFRAKISKHYELVGIKYNGLSYIKSVTKKTKKPA